MTPEERAKKIARQLEGVEIAFAPWVAYIAEEIRAAVEEALDRQQKELHELYLVAKKVAVLEAVEAERKLCQNDV